MLESFGICILFQVNPSILKSSSGVTPATGTPQTSQAVDLQAETKDDGNKYAALSSYLGSPTHSSDPGSPNPFPPPPLASPPSSRKDLSSSPSCASKLYPYLMAKGSSSEGRSDDGIANVVDKILDQRKKLRENFFMSRMLIPVHKRPKNKEEKTVQPDSGIR